MLPKTQRFDRETFTAAFARGRRVHAAGFTLIYTPADTLKAAVVVPKKVLRRATARTALRRRAYAALAQTLPLRGWFIVIGKQPAAAYTFAEITAELGALSARAVGFHHRSR